MKNGVIFLFCLILITASVKAQSIKFKNDNGFKKYNPPYLKFIPKDRLTGYEFQLRLYFGGGPTKIPKNYMLLITNKKGTWSAIKYNITGNPYNNFTNPKVDSVAIQINNYSQFISQLIKDGLLTQTTVDADLIVKLVKARNPNSQIDVMREGGAGYSIELLSPEAERGFYLNSPNAYNDIYQLPELQAPVRIMKTLFAAMQLEDAG